jgi:hypothetical protein
MKIGESVWLDWLHRIRAESEAERRRQGKTIAEWLARAEETADRVGREMADMATPSLTTSHSQADEMACPWS